MAKNLSTKLKTPLAVQAFLRSLEYNRRPRTLWSAETALQRQSAHCLEAAFVAAAILEYHGYPPLVISFESKDSLDHVIFVFKYRGRWGSIARSRDPGLHGRKPIFRTLKALAWSYVDPYVDKTGRITGYQVLNLDDTKSQWRSGLRNVWKAEKYMLELKHEKLKSSESRHKRVYNRYLKKGPIMFEDSWL